MSDYHIRRISCDIALADTCDLLAMLLKEPPRMYWAKQFLWKICVASWSTNAVRPTKGVSCEIILTQCQSPCFSALCGLAASSKGHFQEHSLR